MAGQPGTPRFGVNPTIHNKKTDKSGMSQIKVNETGESMDETHYAYNPEMGGRAMGSTIGDAPCKCYQVVDRQADYYCEHDGYIGGNARLMNIDERKALDNYIMSQNVVFAEDEVGQTYNSDERSA